MPSVLNNRGGSQINFFMSRTPEVVWSEPVQHTTAPKSAKNGPQILTFALQRRPRATRASTNKVKTGCITCKRRHVKCDEVKPACERCVKWQGFCEGYEPPPSGSSTSTPIPDTDKGVRLATRQALVKKKRVAEDVGLCHQPGNVSLLLEPTVNIFQDETERQYFDHWLGYRAQLGGGFFDEELWNETIPQLSRQHASVRYAIMAIGGISKALRHSLKPTSPALMAANGPHYHLALSYYGRAIHEVRGSKLDTGSLRGAIVCCLLFVCFEVLHGDRKAAFAHVNNGQRMMDELLHIRDQKDHDHMQNIIGADFVERDILHVFQRLIQQSWSCGVLRRRDQQIAGRPSDVDGDPSPEQLWCCRGGSAEKCVIHNMPSGFATLQQARRWWDVVQHFVTHSSSIVFRVTHLGLDDDVLSECNERIQRHMDKIEQTRAGIRTATPEQCQGFKEVLELWHRGFEPHWKAAQKSKSEDEKSYAQAAHLRTHYLTMYGCVHAPLSCSYESIAKLTPKYREVVELGEQLFEYQKRSWGDGEMFTMDTGPTWPIFMAGTRCRDPEVRSEAIRLLHENPRRDGLWDSRIFYAMTFRNRMLEASNAQEGTSEDQWWRLQHRSGCIDEHGRLIARALEKNPQTGDWEFGEEDLRRFLHD